LSFWIISKIAFPKLFAFGLPGLIQPLHPKSIVFTSSSLVLSAGILYTHEAGAGYKTGGQLKTMWMSGE
jgi:hypothetical protein